MALGTIIQKGYFYMLTDDDKSKRNFRVWWQHIETYNSFTYPVQEPYFTFTEAQEHVKKENETGYLRSYVIDRSGLSY